MGSGASGGGWEVGQPPPGGRERKSSGGRIALLRPYNRQRADAVLHAPEAGAPVLLLEVDNCTESPETVAAKFDRYRRYFRLTAKGSQGRDVPVWRTLYPPDRARGPPAGGPRLQPRRPHRRAGPENRMNRILDLTRDVWAGTYENMAPSLSSERDGYYSCADALRSCSPRCPGCSRTAPGAGAPRPPGSPPAQRPSSRSRSADNPAAAARGRSPDATLGPAPAPSAPVMLCSAMPRRHAPAPQRRPVPRPPAPPAEASAAPAPTEVPARPPRRPPVRPAPPARPRQATHQRSCHGSGATRVELPVGRGHERRRICPAAPTRKPIKRPLQGHRFREGL
ncbi:replication-relaxation family protein [Streptomyces sp. NBC_01017]|uniref:replication-relaxation family protein n=1 Tax=Streptomyces sp. NBC_01017 TaxID=2903721 RepID=UPI003863356E